MQAWAHSLAKEKFELRVASDDDMPIELPRRQAEESEGDPSENGGRRVVALLQDQGENVKRHLDRVSEAEIQ